MHVAEYAALDATGLSELLRSGQVSVPEVHEAAQRAIAAVNPKLNALVGPPFPQALAFAPDAPFSGVPFALKDIGSHAKGVPQGMGSRLTGAGVVFSDDTDLMARFRAAGLATLCRTSAPEFGFNFSTEPVSNGPTRNPWDDTRSPGGSSGGSAALVAARAVPVAHANDGAGSVRCPAAWCGLVGLKPSRGRTPTGPGESEPILGCGIEFALTRTVRDTAALLDLVAVPGTGERFVLPAPERPYLEEARRDPGRLRIAFSTDPWNGVPVDEAHVQTVRDVARRLDSLGHTVTEARPPIDNEAFDAASVKMWGAVLSHWILGASGLAGVEPTAERLEAVNFAILGYGRTLTALDLLQVQQVINTTTRQVAHWFAGYDVLVTPTMATPAPPLGYLDMQAPLDIHAWWQRMATVGPFTALWNMTGAPALSLPLGMTPSGLPVGVQFVARYLDEATLIRLGAQLEQAMPWSERVPAIHAM
jgi:amidase